MFAATGFGIIGLFGGFSARRRDHPKGAVAESYGAYRETDGVCERALFVLDNKHVIFWSYCSPIAVNPGADGILDALERMPNERKSGHGRAQSPSHAA